MSTDNTSNDGSAASNGTNRRNSITTSTLSGLFGRSNSTSGSHSAGGSQTTGPQRRMSINALGLSGVSPIQTSPFSLGAGRRTSVSTTGSDSIDENAIDDEDGPGSRTVPSTPFSRRMSLGAQNLFASRTAGSPGNSAEGSGLNWSDQFRSRAESTVARPSFAANGPRSPPAHDRAKSVADLPAPPSTVAQPAPAPPSTLSRKPDVIGERMLRGEFYMD